VGILPLPRLERARELNVTKEQPSGKDLFLGIDLGGTKIIAGLVEPSGRIVASEYRQTEAREGTTAVLDRLIDATTQLLTADGIDQHQVVAIGVAAPGPIDVVSGVVTAPPNLPGWHNVPLARLIQERISLPTYLENDANAAALAEFTFGAGRGTEHMIYVTASTGIGGGFVLNGQLYRGALGAAAEIGHMTILPHGPLCGCGNRGCLEALASGTAIAREARERVSRGVTTLIADLAGGDLTKITAKLVDQAAKQGDVEAQGILDEAMLYLGVGMANLVNLLNPQVIVIGGGLTKMGDRLFGPVRRTIDRRAFPVSASAVEIRPAELGGDVGLLGAAAVAMTTTS
jgi:glucokinase